MTAAVRLLLPRALADRVRVADAATDRLILAVPAGAIAAVIRQRLPDLLAGLRREGLHFTQIEVRVQVKTYPGPQPKKATNQAPRANAAPLRALADDLPAGPLRDAVARLARRSS